jgi:hypothetical protein
LYLQQLGFTEFHHLSLLRRKSVETNPVLAAAIKTAERKKKLQQNFEAKPKIESSIKSETTSETRVTHHRSSLTIPVFNAEDHADDGGVDDVENGDDEKIGQQIMAAVRRGDQKEVLPDTDCPMYFQFEGFHLQVEQTSKETKWQTLISCLLLLFFNFHISGASFGWRWKASSSCGGGLG